MNIDSATTNAALLVGLAIVVLIAAGWRKPASAASRSHRGSFGGGSGVTTDLSDDVRAVHEAPTEGYRPPSIWRRLRGLVGGTVMAVLLGAVIATVAGYGAALVVIRLTDLLKQ